MPFHSGVQPPAVRCPGARIRCPLRLKVYCGTPANSVEMTRGVTMSDARWADRPNPEDLPDQWKIHRVPAGGLQSALVLSDDTSGCYVHYWKGRTTPCLDIGCVPCINGQTPRWRGYVACLIGPGRLTRILEVTACCVPAIVRYKNEWSTLRGSIISLTRKGRKANGELECVFGEKPVAGSHLPVAPELVPYLKRLWRTTHEAKPSELSLDASTVLRRAGLIPTRNGKH